MTTFPDTLYVKREVDVDGKVYFSAEKKPSVHAEIGEDVKIGVYVLSEVKRLVTMSELVR